MARAEERVERRLTAILAADVAGYSRLMGEDEEGTLATLKGHRRELLDPKIAEHRGRIVKTTGDGLLVEFASVVDAVRCAVEVQREMAERNVAVPAGQRIEFRVGINLGDIIIDEGDIYGDGVNIAARLEALAEPGGICVSRVVRDQVRDKLDFAFEDRGDQQVKNIARPVRIYRVGPRAAGSQSPHPNPPLPGLDPGTTGEGVPAEGSLNFPPLPGLDPGITGEGRVGAAAPTLALPDKPSIAVLPFQNMSGDPEQEYFADGMVEEIITALSRIRWLFVIARNSSFTYKGQAVDVKQVGRELGVRYVLEGSVRKGGNRVRITAQLIDASDGTHLWADRFDGSLDDVFELQGQVAGNVAGVIEPTVQAAEIRRSASRPTSDLTAYDLYLRALPLIRAHAKDPAEQALDLLGRAIERDPHYGLALAAAAICHSQLAWFSNDPESERRQGVALARRALQIAGDDPNAVVNAVGALANFAEDVDPLMALIDNLLTLNPSFAFAWSWSGWLRLFAGRPEIAIEHFETALRLDPRSTLRAIHLTGIGVAHFFGRRFDEAASVLLESLQQVPTYPMPLRALASCYAHMGRLDEARELIARLRHITPVVLPPFSHFRDLEQRELLRSGLRLAMGETS
jgi:adenylate cyclase